MNMHWKANPELLGWTPERIELLTKLWADGFSASIIAGSMGGTSRNAVIGKVHRLKLPRRRVTVKEPYRAGDRPSWSVERHAREAELRAMRPRQPKKPPAPRVRPPKPIPQPAFDLDPRDMGIGAWDALADSMPVSLVDLEAGMCRWPIGADSPYLFCGCQVIPGKSYCGTHVERARGKGTESERAAHRGSKRYDIGTGGRWA